MPSVHERLVEARQVLTRAGIAADEAALDVEVLARHVLGWDRATIVARWREAAPAGFVESLDILAARRADREPLAYITGHREFWGLDFAVTPAVLIPRPETEIVLEEARLFAAEVRLPRFAIDVGTGSGCLAVALARECPDVRVTGTDISPAALAVARRNANRLGVAHQLTLTEADLLEGIAGAADLIVSNPPYVAAGDASSLAPEVRLHEPHGALFGGDADGLHIVRRLLASAAAHLAPGGRLIMEFGFGQDGAVRDAARNAGWDIVRVTPDLQAIPRVAVLGRLL